MNKGLLTLMALATLMIAPVASAALHHTFVGPESCHGQTKTCEYNKSALHYADLLPVGDVGRGTMYLNTNFHGTCIFASGSSCVSGTYGGTLLYPGNCSPTLRAETYSLITGASAPPITWQKCNPF